MGRRRPAGALGSPALSKTQPSQIHAQKSSELIAFLQQLHTSWIPGLLCSPKIRHSTIYYAGLLGRWDKWIVDQVSDVPSFIFFYTFYRLRALKTFYFYFCNLKKNKKMNWKDFCKEFCKKSWKKNNIWNIRRLVDDSFVPSSKRPSIWYCKLTNFNWEISRQKLTFSLYKNCTCTNWPASKIQKLVVLHKLRLNWLHSQNS